MLCSAQHDALAEVRACVARGDVCSAAQCTSDFKARYSGGRLMPQLVAVQSQASSACSADEKRIYEAANACAAQSETASPCDVAACFQDYQMRFPAGQWKTQTAQRISGVAERCSLETEKRAVNLALPCARSNPCTAESCFARYRAEFPSGRLRGEVETVVTSSRQLCAPAQPAPTRPQPGLREWQPPTTTDAPPRPRS